MRDLPLMRFLHPEPRRVGCSLRKQRSPHPQQEMMPPKTVRLAQRQHLPALPSAQEDVWLYRKTGSLRAPAPWAWKGILGHAWWSPS